MASMSRTSYFEYWDESPSDWQRLLQERLGRGETQIVIPVLWGVHESAPGMRDFSKQSKFRIEKVLTLAQGLGLSVKVVVGFPSHPQTFPTWVFQENQKEWIPKAIWEGEPPYFSLVSVPSPQSTRVKEGFLSFLEEVTSILSLYVAPDGPVTEVVLDLKPLEFSQSLASGPNYTHYLGRRYPDVSVFNKRFQTHYRNLESVATVAGSKLIEGKRPWVFAFDYRWCREQVVEDYFSEVLRTLKSENLKKLLKRSYRHEIENFRGEYPLGICIESAWVQVDEKGTLCPFIPDGILSQSMINAFQWTSLLKESSKDLPTDFRPLPILEKDASGNYKAMTVICGKYMSLAGSSYLAEQLKNGCKLFFPTGLPQYDENLETQMLFIGGVRKSVKLEGVEWIEISKENGHIYFPANTAIIANSAGIRKWLTIFSSLIESL